MGKAEDDHMRFSRAQVGLLDALLMAQPEADVDAAFQHRRVPGQPLQERDTQRLAVQIAVAAGAAAHVIDGDGDRLHAERLRQVDRRRVHQQHVLDRRHRADRFVAGRRAVHSLLRRQVVACRQKTPQHHA